MTSSPAPEFDQFLHDFITSFATTVFAGAASTPPPDLAGEEEEEESLVFRVFTIGPIDIDPVDNRSLPASKAAIEAMPVVTVTAAEEEEEENCAICLTEYGVDGKATEMACKHRYHSDCIEKWLSIHGSCPICRYEMPVDLDEEKRRWRDDGGMRWRVMITVTREIPPAGDLSDRNSLDLMENNGLLLTEDMDMEIDLSRDSHWNSNSNSMMDID